MPCNRLTSSAAFSKSERTFLISSNVFCRKRPLGDTSLETETSASVTNGLFSAGITVVIRLDLVMSSPNKTIIFCDTAVVLPAKTSLQFGDVFAYAANAVKSEKITDQPVATSPVVVRVFILITPLSFGAIH